jgi:hypothetical protein
MRLQIEVRDALYDQVRSAAAANGQSISEFVRDALAGAIDKEGVKPAPQPMDFGIDLPRGVQRGVAGIKSTRGQG